MNYYRVYIDTDANLLFQLLFQVDCLEKISLCFYECNRGLKRYMIFLILKLLQVSFNFLVELLWLEFNFCQNHKTFGFNRIKTESKLFNYTCKYRNQSPRFQHPRHCFTFGPSYIYNRTNQHLQKLMQQVFLKTKHIHQFSFTTPKQIHMHWCRGLVRQGVHKVKL